MAQHNVIKDKGEYFVIDPAAYAVRVPTTHRIIGTEENHLSEQITFVCPQIIDGHDISQCGRHYVSWLNTEGTPGHDELKIDRIEDDNVYFAWDVRNGLTLKKGVVQFSVHFEDMSSADGSRLYKWSTATCSQCEILGCINAALGTYEAVYVAGDTLVFADYNPVKDSALEIGSAMVPDGTITLTKDGEYDVAKYAQAVVKTSPEAPRISVSPTGEITATDGAVECKLQLSAEHDADFVAENIKKGVNIFGVEGTFKHDIPLVSGQIANTNTGVIDSGFQYLLVHYSGCEDGTGDVDFSAFHKIPHGHTFSAQFVKGSVITIQSAWDYNTGTVRPTDHTKLGVTSNVEQVHLDENPLDTAKHPDIYIFKPTGDGFVIQVTSE